MSIRNELLEQISGNMFDIKNNATIAGYGSIGVDGATALASPINSTPQTLTGFDVELITSPRGVTQDLGTNSLALLVKGVWTLMVKVSLTFDEDIAKERSISFQLQNIDAPIPSPTIFRHSVPKSAASKTMTIALPFDVGSASVGDKFVIQVLSETDTFLNCTDIGSTFSFTNNAPITELT
jgi:hypothetical protein